MNIRTKNSIKLDGTYILPGSELEVDDGVAAYLIAKGAADALEGEEEDIDAVMETEAETTAKTATTDEIAMTTAELELADDEERALAELQQVDGVTKSISRALYAAGYRSIEALQAANPLDLEEVRGIDAKRAARICKDVAEFIVDEGEE